MASLHRLLAIPLAVALVAVALLGAPERAAADESPAAAWEALRLETVTKLHGLAKFCVARKLYRNRIEVFEGLLRFDPDDKTARKFLKFKRSRDGAWVRRGRWTPPRNSGKGEADYIAERAKLGSWFALRAEVVRDAADEAGDTATRAAIETAAAGVDPDRPSFRAWGGEVADPRAEGSWILQATLQARSRRPGIRAAAERALAKAEAPAPTDPSARDRHGGASWSAGLQSEHLRAFGVGDPEELLQCVKNSEAAWPVFKYAFDREPNPIRGSGERRLTLYVFDTSDAGNAFLHAQPGLDARRKEFLTPLASVWLPKRPAVLIKSAQGPLRLEAAGRQPNQWFVTRNFGLQKRNLWVREATVLYLTYQTTRTRLISSMNDKRSAYAEPDAELPSYEKNLHESDADWYALGLELLESKDKPNIYLLPGTELNKLTKVDILYGWCVATFLIEGHPKQAADFFGTLGSDQGSDIDSVCLDILGYSAKTLDTRLKRWLRETADV